MDFAKIGRWLATVGSASVGVLAILAAMNYFEIRPIVVKELKATEVRVAANTRAVQLIRWQLLNEKRQNQGLTVSELVEFCELSRALGLKGQGCA
jgi:hypothetical protein